MWLAILKNPVLPSAVVLLALSTPVTLPPGINTAVVIPLITAGGYVIVWKGALKAVVVDFAIIAGLSDCNAPLNVFSTP